MCLELGKILAQTEEFKRMKQAEQNLLHDSEARKLVEDLQMMQAEQRKMQMAGREFTQEQMDRLKEAEKTALANPTVKTSQEATADFHSLMNKITGKIKEGIRI
ncbi:MAG: YlbF family regulator, partial [Firmicutes bacterium]|nr:YlbF family regulator [Bacillota bacterium]